MQMFSSTLRSGTSDSSWKTETMPRLDGVARAAEPDVLAVEDDLSGVGPDDAADHLDQGALARPVLTQDRMNRALVRLEVDLVQRHDAAERLADATQAQERRFARFPLAHRRPR